MSLSSIIIDVHTDENKVPDVYCVESNRYYC